MEVKSKKRHHTSSISGDDVSRKRKKVKFQSTEPSEQKTSENTDKSTKKKPVSRPKPKINALKSKGNSWITHIACTVVYKCVQQAVNNCIDAREHLESIDWSVWAPEVLDAKDLQKVWFYINREYSVAQHSLPSLLEDLKPYNNVTLNDVIKEDIKIKYKDQVPKPPVSAYFLFSKSKSRKLKEKHPELTQTELAVRLGRKWRSYGEEKQCKYKKQYAELREQYQQQLEEFYTEHPDARPPAPIPRRSRPTVVKPKPHITLEEQKIRLLKQQAPKQPLSAYFIFCKKKRNKVQTLHPMLSPCDVTVKLGKKWKSMNEQERSKYKQEAERCHELYKQELELFYEQHPGAKEMFKLMRKKKKPESTKSETSIPSSTGLTETNHNSTKMEEDNESDDSYGSEN